MRRDWLAQRLPMLLPLAVAWARRQERRILRLGVALTETETEDATAVGVGDVSRVRLLKVKVVPWPASAILRRASKAIGFDIDATCGVTLGHGIFIREDCWRDRALI